MTSYDVWGNSWRFKFNLFYYGQNPLKLIYTTLILETITQYHLNVKLPYFQLFSFILEMSRLCYKQPKYSTMQCFARANILYIQNLRLAETSETRYECTAWQKNNVFCFYSASCYDVIFFPTVIRIFSKIKIRFKHGLQLHLYLTKYYLWTKK